MIPSIGDLVTITMGGAFIPEYEEICLWLGADYPMGMADAWLYMTGGGLICRTFNGQKFVIVSQFKEALG